MTSERKRLLALSAVALVVLAIAAALVLSFSSSEETSTSPAPSPSPTTSTPRTSAPGVSYMPLMEAFPNAPEPPVEIMTAAVSRNAVRSSGGSNLTISGRTLQGTSAPCSVVESTDFCISSRVSGSPAADIYFLKDAVRNRLFENPKDFEKATVAGSPAAGTLSLPIGKTSRAAAVIVNEDSTGWLLLLADNDKSAMKSLLADTSVK